MLPGMELRSDFSELILQLTPANQHESSAKAALQHLVPVEVGNLYSWQGLGLCTVSSKPQRSSSLCDSV